MNNVIQHTHPYSFGIVPQFQNIPDWLRSGQWCYWKANPRKKKPNKFDKIPFAYGKGISTGNPERWMTFNQAYQQYYQYQANGIGRLVNPNENLIYCDVDNCWDGKNWNQTALDMLQAFHGHYTEFSPSGAGIRIVVQDSNRVTDFTNRQAGLEIYSGSAARYLTITGHVIFGE